MEITQKDIQNVSGGIIACFEASHYLNECSHLKVFRHTVKKNLTRTIEDLKHVEVMLYNEVEKSDEKDIQSKKVDNCQDFTKWLLNKFDNIDVQKLKEVCVAYSLDPNRLTPISDKILQKHGAEKV